MLTNHFLDIFIYCSDGTQTETILQHLQHIRRDESGQCGTDVDILHTKAQQRQQYDDCLLLIPSNVEDDRKVVDAIHTKDLLQLQGRCQ